MTKDNSTPGVEDGVPHESPRAKNRHRRLKITLEILFLISLLVLVAPNIMATSFVRGLIVDHINQTMLNGTLEIDDWDFGWTDGVTLNRVRLSDANGSQVLQIKTFSAGISFVKAIFGHYDLGDVKIDGMDFNAVRDKDGKVNFAALLKPSPTSNAPSGKLPNIKGTLHLANTTGTFQDDTTHTLLTLDSIVISAAVNDINEPIAHSVEIKGKLNGVSLGTVKLEGSIGAIQNNAFSAGNVTGNEILSLAGIDLASISPILKAEGIDLNVTGQMSGQVKGDLAADHVKADGEIAVADASAGGGVLRGDTVRYQKIDVKITESSDKSSFKLDLPLVATPAGNAQADGMAIHVDAPADALKQTGAVFGAIADRLLKGKPQAAVKIAGTGTAEATFDVGIANLLMQLPHALPRVPGTAFHDERLSEDAMMTFANGQAAFSLKTNMPDFVATVGATVVGGDAPDLQKVAINVTSPYLNVTGGGDTLAKTSVSGTFDLELLQQEMEKFVDLDAAFRVPSGSHVVLKGGGHFQAHSSGSFAVGDSVEFSGELAMANLEISGLPGKRPVQEPTLAASFDAGRDAKGLKDYSFKVQAPSMDLAANGDAQLGEFEVSNGSIDLALLQDELGGLLSFMGVDSQLLSQIADNSLRIASGKMVISGKTQFGPAAVGIEQPLVIHIDPLDLTVPDDSVAGSRPIHTPAMDVQVTGTGTVDEKFVAVVKNLAAQITIGTGADQMLAVQLSADATTSVAPSGMLSGTTFSRIDLVQCRGDAAKLQGTFGPLLPLLLAPISASTQPSTVELVERNLVTVASGTFNATASATFDGTTLALSKPLMATLTNLTLVQPGGAATAITGTGFTATINGSVKNFGGAQSLDASVHVEDLTVNDRLKDQTLDATAKATRTADAISGGELHVNGPGLGTIDLTKFAVGGLGGDPAGMVVQGNLTMDGEVAPLARLAELVAGAKANAYPYQGHFHFDEAVAKPAGAAKLNVTGGGGVAQFAVLGADGKTVSFSEPQLAVANGFDFDFQTYSLVIDPAKPISLSLKQSGALTVAVQGTVSDLRGQRKLDGTTIQLTYDLAKLWTIVKPLLSADQQAKLADLQISGSKSATFTIAGSLPAGQAFGVAIANLSGGGVMEIDSIATHGVAIQNFEVPLALGGGILRTVYPGEAEGQNAPKPAACNSGTIDLGVWAVDLRHDPMLLSIGGVDAQHPHALVHQVSLNPALTGLLLNKVLNNPAFGDPSSARGLLDLSILNCQNIPLSGLATQESPANTGVAEVQYSAHELNVGTPLLSSIPGLNDSVPMEIDNADMKLSQGKITQDTTILIDKTKPLRIAGVVGLQSRQFEPMTVYIPVSLLGNLLGAANLRQYMPDTVQVPMEGDMEHPKIRLDKTAGQLIQDAAKKALLGGLLGGKQK